MKVWDLEDKDLRYRVVYAFEPRRQHYHVLAVAPREFNYDASHPPPYQPAASSAPTKRFEKVFRPPGTEVETISRTHCQVFIFKSYVPAWLSTSAKYTSIGDLVGKWERGDDKRAALEEGRQWVASTLYGEDGDTVRTLRLRKGWSQAHLGTELRTSQSHIVASSGVRRT